MINKIKVKSNRTLCIKSTHFGVTSEHNAEILQFEFPELINGYRVESCVKKVKLTNEDGTLEVKIMHTDDETSDTVKIDSSWTTRPNGILWVEIDTPTSAKDKMHWLSYPYPVEFKTKPVEDGGSIIDIIRKEVENELLVNIRDSFKYNIGGKFEYNNMQLNQLIGEAPVNEDMVVVDRPYDSGVLYKTASKLQLLVNLFTDNITTGAIGGIYDNIIFLNEETSKIKGYVVNAINRTLGTDFPPNTAWVELVEAIQKLPDDVEIKVDGIVSDTITETVNSNNVSLAMALNTINPDIDYSNFSWEQLLDSVKALKGDKDRIARLKSELSAKLPLMNFDKMTDEQMVEALTTLITEIVSQPAGF